MATIYAVYDDKNWNYFIAGEGKDYSMNRYIYNVNGFTGEIMVPKNATDNEIKLAIIDDLYEVTYEKVD